MRAKPTFAVGQATAPSTKVTRLNRVEAGHSVGDEELDHFIRRDGKTFAGSHLIIIFMCGDAEPVRAIPVLARAFRPRRTLVNEQLRGVVDDAGV
jgi:hypothetical protein